VSKGWPSSPKFSDHLILLRTIEGKNITYRRLHKISLLQKLSPCQTIPHDVLLVQEIDGESRQDLCVGHFVSLGHALQSPRRAKNNSHSLLSTFSKVKRLELS
jgi:hypothetical protein